MHIRRKYNVTAVVTIGGIKTSVPVWFYVDHDVLQAADHLEVEKEVRETIENAKLSFKGDEKWDIKGSWEVYEPTIHPSDSDMYFTFMGITIERPQGEFVLEVAFNEDSTTVSISTSQDTYNIGVWGGNKEKFREDCAVLHKTLGLK